MINAMNIERIVSYSNSENCYIVYDEDKNGVIIDPGCEAEEIIEYLNELGVIAKAIFLTHCHYDHITGLEDLRKILGLKVYSSFECNQNIQNPAVNYSLFNEKQIKAMPSEEILNDNSTVKIGNLEIKAIKTPGHTNGSMCFLIGEDLFSGDTLFLRSVGRWDLPKGDENSLKKSIIEKLYKLDDDIIVHPGHGNDTKIYYEKRYNTYVKG